MFLNNLTYLLDKNNMSRNELAREVGIAPSTINSWYNRGYENVSLKTLRKLSRYFDITIDELVDGDISNNKAVSEICSCDLETIKAFNDLLEIYKNKNTISRVNRIFENEEEYNE